MLEAHKRILAHYEESGQTGKAIAEAKRYLEFIDYLLKAERYNMSRGWSNRAKHQKRYQQLETEHKRVAGSLAGMEKSASANGGK